MSEKQLRLLPYAKPLTDRLGREFFLSIPKEPGVYFNSEKSQPIQR